MGESATKRVAVALVLCVVAAAVSGLLLLQHHGETRAVSAVNQVCGAGTTSGCEEVARSSWSSVHGYPLAALGALFYSSLATLLALILLAPVERRDPLAGLALAGLAAGLVVDLFLLGVQVFAVHAYCSLCALTYLLGAGSLAVLWPAWRGVGALVKGPGSPELRLALAGWWLTTLAVAGALVFLNWTLTYRAAARQSHLLGEPLPVATSVTPAPAAPSPSPVPSTEPKPAPSPAAGDGDAAYWKERAEKLQETIDDPRKLDAYFAQKARHEYETERPATIDLQGVPARGPLTAPVKVVEFSDFLCPYCRNLAAALAQFIPQAGGRLVVYYKNYPLDAACNPRLKQSTHPGSCNLALGGICANNQGKFEAYHDRVFGTELHDPQPADVVRLAGEAGLNAAAMQGCLEDPQTRKTLDAQIAEGNRLGVSSTPTLYVNGKKLPRIPDFVSVVDEEARKKGFAPLAQ